jgi:hypothetical protein
MLTAAVTDRAIKADTSVQRAIDLLWAHPQICVELVELFGVLDGRREQRWLLADDSLSR